MGKETLNELQAKHAAWDIRNFCGGVEYGDRHLLRCALGVAEESGELAHAVLKRDQGIRGSAGKHEAAMRDAVGDISLFTMAICSEMGWSFEQVVRETIATVIQRDWIADPDGAGGASVQEETTTCE